MVVFLSVVGKWSAFDGIIVPLSLDSKGFRPQLRSSHNPEVGGSNPSPATIKTQSASRRAVFLSFGRTCSYWPGYEENIGDDSLCSETAIVFSFPGRAEALPEIGFSWEIGDFARNQGRKQCLTGHSEKRHLIPVIAPVDAPVIASP